MVSFKEYLKVKEELLNEGINYQDCINQNACEEINKALANINSDAIQDKIKTLATNEKYKDAFKKFMVAHIICNKAKRKSAISDKDDNSLLNQALNKFNKGTISPEIKKYKDAIDSFLKKSDIDFDDNSSIDNFLNSFDINDLASHVDEQNKFNDLINQIKNAKNQDELNKLEDGIEEFEEESLRNQLEKEVNNKSEELKNNPEETSEAQGQKSKPENTQEGGNSGNNTQVSNSNTSSSFSKDDWEILFKEKNEAEIKKILNKVASNTISKMEKILNDRASQVLKDKDLMEEDAQEELWNIINERINLGNGSYLERDKGKSVNMYKDGSVGKNDDGSINAGNANETFKHYKQEIEFMTSNVAGRIAEINGNRSFNSSDGKLNKLRNQVRSVVLDYHNELLDIKNEFDKKISKVGLFQKNKINKARQKEKDDERFNSSEQGEMYSSALKEKTNQIYNAFNSSLKRSQVKTFDDMVAKQIATLAASSMDAKSFAKSCMFKRVLTEDGKTMFVLKYLSNKGIKIPLFDGKDHKQSGLDAKAYSDAFNKFKQELADNEKYSNDSVIKNLVDAINKETSENQANDNGLKTEATLIRKALKKDIRDNNQGQQNNNPPRGLRNRAEAADQEIEDNNMKNLEDNEDFDATVTTAKCDGLPIGARRYSRAIRRRMNYALNKYM